jgi:hypothetical protein
MIPKYLKVNSIPMEKCDHGNYGLEGCPDKAKLIGGIWPIIKTTDHGEWIIDARKAPGEFISGTDLNGRKMVNICQDWDITFMNVPIDVEILE